MTRRGLFLLLAMGCASAWTLPAHADPCEGKLPRAGTEFSGIVRYVGDGDGLCLGPNQRPDLWVEVRLGDFYAPELNSSGGRAAKRQLTQLVLGKTLVCRAGRRSYDRVIGYCKLGGQPLGRLLRRGGARQGGRGWQHAR